jgi:hypothetical protein
VAVGGAKGVEVGAVGEANGLCCGDRVIADRVEATIVGTMFVPGVGVLPFWRLQAARRRTRNNENARREEEGFMDGLLDLVPII